MLMYIGIPSMKFIGPIEFEIWTIVWRKLIDVTLTSSSIRETLISNLLRACISKIPNFMLIGYTGAEIHSREVNR